MNLSEIKSLEKIVDWIMRLRAILREPDDSKARVAATALVTDIVEAEDDKS